MNEPATRSEDSELRQRVIPKSGGRSRARTYDPLIKRYPALAEIRDGSESYRGNRVREGAALTDAIPNNRSATEDVYRHHAPDYLEDARKAFE